MLNNFELNLKLEIQKNLQIVLKESDIRKLITIFSLCINKELNEGKFLSLPSVGTFAFELKRGKNYYNINTKTVEQGKPKFVFKFEPAFDLNKNLRKLNRSLAWQKKPYVNSNFSKDLDNL